MPKINKEKSISDSASVPASVPYSEDGLTSHAVLSRLEKPICST